MPSDKKLAILRDTFLYGSANYVVQFLGIINSVALRTFLGPTAMGIWSFLQVILGYCGYASFGTTKALARDYPYLRGLGKHPEAERLKDLVLTFTMLGSFLPLMILAAYLTLKWESLSIALRIGLCFLAGFLFLQRFYDLVLGLLRADKKFSLLSRLIVWNAAGGLLVTFVLVKPWRLNGLYLGTTLVLIGCLFFIFRNHSYRFRFYWNWTEMKRELRLGIPLVAVAFLLNFLRSMDKLILAKMLGFYEVGLYSLAMMMSSYLLSLPMMFAQVWYPNLQEKYGQAGGDIAAIGHYLEKPVKILSVMIPVACGTVIFLAPILVSFFMPQFMPGLVTMKIYVIGIFFVMTGQLSSDFLITLDKYLVLLPLLLLSVAISGFASWVLIHAGLGLNGVAVGSVLGFVSYGIAAQVLANRHFLDRGRVVPSVLKPCYAVSVLFFLIFLIDAWISVTDLVISGLLKTILFFMCAVPYLWRIECDYHLVRDLIKTTHNGDHKPPERADKI